MNNNYLFNISCIMLSNETTQNKIEQISKIICENFAIDRIFVYDDNLLYSFCNSLTLTKDDIVNDINLDLLKDGKNILLNNNIGEYIQLLFDCNALEMQFFPMILDNVYKGFIRLDFCKQTNTPIDINGIKTCIYIILYMLNIRFIGDNHFELVESEITSNSENEIINEVIEEKIELFNQLIVPKVYILIADENDVYLKYMKLILSKYKANVTIVSSSSNLAEIMKRNMFSLVILDINYKDVYSIIDHIRELKGQYYKTLPIIGLCYDKNEIYSDYFNDYLVKPTLDKDIVEVLEKHISENLIEFEDTPKVESTISKKLKISSFVDIDKVRERFTSITDYEDILKEAYKNCQGFVEFLKNYDFVEVNEFKKRTNSFLCTLKIICAVPTIEKLLLYSNKNVEYIKENIDSIINSTEELLDNIYFYFTQNLEDEFEEEDNSGIEDLRLLIEQYNHVESIRVINQFLKKDDIDISVKNLLLKAKTKLEIYDYNQALSIIEEI